jgi:flagellin
VDIAGLGILNTSVQGGGTELTGNSVNLNNTAVNFLAGGTQTFTFHVGTSAGNQDVTVNVAGGTTGLTGNEVVDSLNNSLSSYGITSSIAPDGTLQFGGSTAFTLSTAAATAGNAIATAASTATNTADYNLDSSTGPGGAFVPFSTGGGTSASETIVFQNAGSTKTITLDDTNASTLSQALSTLNTSLNSVGIYAVTAANGSDISFQSASTFSTSETAYTAGAGGGAGNLFGGVGALTVNAPASAASDTGNAIFALSAIETAINHLGLTQGNIGAGINRLNYAVTLAQSQITNYSAAESGIRDADVAEEAANLTKAQVLQQASLAALSQANAEPQAVLSLLKQ